MKLLIAILLLVGSLNVNASQCTYKDEFSYEQWHHVRAAFIDGWVDDLSWSLAALVIAESSAGQNLINNITQDYGVMQNNIKTATTRLKRWETSGRNFSPYNLNDPEDIKTILITDRAISVQLAIEELIYWKKVRGSNWREVYASYNGGFYKNTPREKRVQKYASNIVVIIRKLKACKREIMRGIY